MTDEACTIERLSTEEDLDAVAALEADAFANPWTREMLARERQALDDRHAHAQARERSRTRHHGEQIDFRQ